jgi:hypothetical protein
VIDEVSKHTSDETSLTNIKQSTIVAYKNEEKLEKKHSIYIRNG